MPSAWTRRLEAEALLLSLISRVERIAFAGTPVRKLNNTLRSWKSVPLRLVPA